MDLMPELCVEKLKIAKKTAKYNCCDLIISFAELGTLCLKSLLSKKVSYLKNRIYKKILSSHILKSVLDSLQAVNSRICQLLSHLIYTLEVKC